MSKRPVALLMQQAQHAARAGDHAKAIKLLKRALRDRPASEEIARMLAESQLALGQPAEAVAMLRKALLRSPEHLPMLLSLAHAHRAAGELRAALEVAHQATRLAPDDAATWHVLGRTQMAAADAPTAHATLQKAAAIAPDDDDILALLADAQLSTGIYPLPFDHAQTMVERQPNVSRNHSRLGNAYRLNARFDEAMASFDQALALDRLNLEAVAGKADVLESLGRTDEAIALIKPRIVTGQTSFLMLTCWARLCQRTKDFNAAIGPMEQFISSSRASAWHRSNLLIRLGQLYEKVGRYDEAFQAWTVGNRLHRGRWDPEAHASLIDELIEAFSETAMKTLPRSTVASEQPVFIVGMYRSGTTLTEQILSAHPDIAGAGELGQLVSQIRDLPDRLGTSTPYPACVSQLTPDVLTELANDYFDYAHQLADNEARITDKMPMNYLNIGMISLMFPNARIIHCTRNPLDTCISCFGNAFSSRMAFTADLGHLGHAYRHHLRIMDHWQRVNTVPIMELNYESLVSDPEPLLRRVLDFIGLPFDPACLKHHESKRINITPSVDQVREPLYRGSIGRAGHYEAHLEPLKTALGSQAPASQAVGTTARHNRPGDALF